MGIIWIGLRLVNAAERPPRAVCLWNTAKVRHSNSDEEQRWVSLRESSTFPGIFCVFYACSSCVSRPVP